MSESQQGDHLLQEEGPAARQADGRAAVDFTGSAPQHVGNLNATPAIVHSAVIYVLRLLIGEGLPLNEGLMRAVRVIVPRGMLNPEFPADPARCPAVAGGMLFAVERRTRC